MNPSKTVDKSANQKQELLVDGSIEIISIRIELTIFTTMTDYKVIGSYYSRQPNKHGERYEVDGIRIDRLPSIRKLKKSARQ